MASAERTRCEWFQEASRCYVDGHQACAWCGRAHRVFKTRRGSRKEYYCFGCEFYVSHDEDSDQYFLTPGRRSQGASAPVTIKVGEAALGM
jgi:hypothetical protein